MKLNIKVENSRQHFNLWLTLFQSGSNLTDREKSILVEILVRREELSKSGISEPYLTKLLFDTDSKDIICKLLEISGFSYANALKSMKDKGVITENLSIQHTLIPEDRLEFNFKYE